MEKKQNQPQDGRKGAPEKGAEEPGFSKRWLRRFLAGLAITFASLALAMWLYSLWGHTQVVKPAATQLASDDPAVYSLAVSTMETPHIFSGYDPYHGFGTEAGARRFESVKTLVSRGRAYSDREKGHLIRGIAHYIPAFIEAKIDGNTPVVEGDKEIISSIYARWDNALRTGIVFAIHLTIASLLMGLLFFLYWNLKLFSRFE